MNLNRNISLLIIIFILATGSLLKAEDEVFYIVVNKSNPVTSLTKSEVSQIFLKTTSVWNNGQEVKPVDLTADNDVRRKFSKEVHGRRTNAVKNYWQQMIFSGRDVPPPELNSDTEVINYVKKNSNLLAKLFFYS